MSSDRTATLTPAWLDWLGSGLLGAPMAVGLRTDAAAASDLGGDAAARAAPPPRQQRPVLTRTQLPRLLLPLLLPSAQPDDSGLSPKASQRAAVAHAVGHLRHSTPGQSVQGLKPMAVAVVSALEDARVDLLLMRDYPGLRSWFLPWLASPQPVVGLDFASLMSRLDRVLLDPLHTDRNPWVQQARQRFEAIRDLHDAAACRRVAAVLANELGQMRVPFDAALYQVHAAYRDDNSYLWDFERTATDDTAAVPVEAAIGPQLAANHPQPALSEAATGQVTACYPEWDQRLQRMRPLWCAVRERAPVLDGTAPPLQPAPGMHSRAPQRDARPTPRQRDGDALHLDAAIAAARDLRLGVAPDARIFTRQAARGARQRNASLLLLIDLSQSTNDALATRPAQSHPQTVLDLEKQAALHLARHGAWCGTRIAVHGFHSRTRADVGYYRLLDFGGPLDAAALHRIGTVRAGQSTRTGAALRHASACLDREHTRRRAILLITDGVPSDIDVFMPDHLLHDAQRAVGEARQRGFDVRCLAVGAQADDALRQMFGMRHFDVLASPAGLPRLSLSTAFGRGWR